MYPARMTRFYFNIANYMQNRLKYDKNQENHSFLYKKSAIFRVLVGVVWDPSPIDVWTVRLSIDYMVRFITSVSSGIGYMLVLLWARYGYNSHFFTVTSVDRAQFRESLIFVGIGTGLEVVMFYTIEKCLDFTLQLNMRQYWTVLVKHRPMYITFFIFALQHVMTDVLIAKLIVSFG